MTARNINKHQAGLYTRVAQVALVALVLASGAVAALGLPGGSIRDPGDLTLPPVETPSGDPALVSTAPPVDLGAISDRLNRIKNSPKAPEVVVAATKPADTPPPTPPAPDEVRYLGGVGLGSHMMALVSVGGKQVFVAIGDKIAIGTVRSVTATEVQFEGETGTHVIRLAERGPEVVTRTTPGAAARAMAGVGVRPLRPPGNQFTFPSASGQAFQAQPDGSLQKLPEYVSPDHGMRYEQLRGELKSSGKFSSEEELNETAAKVLEQELSGEKKKGDQR